MWIFTLCEFRPGESWKNAVYISSENVLNTKIDCSKNVLLIVVLVEYKLKWMCCYIGKGVWLELKDLSWYFS